MASAKPRLEWPTMPNTCVIPNATSVSTSTSATVRTWRGRGQADVDPVRPFGHLIGGRPVGKALRRPAGQRVVVIPVPGTAQPAVLDRALAERTALMRAPVLQRAQPRAA